MRGSTGLLPNAEELREAYDEMPELVERAERLLAGARWHFRPPDGHLHNNHTPTRKVKTKTSR